MAEYEFSEEQNRIIKGVSIRCITQCVLLASIGVLIFLMAIVNFFNGVNGLVITFSFVIQAICFVIMGVVFFRPADNLRNVVYTEGRDITEMMTAMRDLNGGFLVLIILIVITVIFDFVMLLAEILMLP
ncbi:MAG: hypothetical protein ACFFBD_19415 [Candidatus Hodarchaeota archaeon]